MSVYIIAEAGVNHNGSNELAHELVDTAADAGADAVKFQTFNAANMITKSAVKADYQKKNEKKNETQYEMLERLELNHEQHFELKTHAQERGVDFLSTAFDLMSLNFLLSQLKMKTIKVSSGELTNHPLLFAHACSGVKIILSTGMAIIEEVEDALSAIAFGLLVSKGETANPSVKEFKLAYQSEKGRKLLKKHVSLLHCTSEYPTSLNDVNLHAMQTLKENFGLSVGYSDHTLGIKMASLAVAAGAEILEKHFTLDKLLKGPDHAMSLSPSELKNYVKAAREVEQVMGSYEKIPTNGELVNRDIGRKIIVAKKLIEEGEILSESNLDFKRSKNIGFEPSEYWEILGNKAVTRIESDAAITNQNILRISK